MARLWLLVALSLTGAAAAAGECRNSTVELRGDWGQARFTVEVADTMESRARGLMYRDSLPSSSGMLFVYERAQRLGFWMKNTLIPLDMLFIDEDGRVESIHAEAVPHDVTPIHSQGPAIMVLEINGGLAKALGIAVGSEVRHPLVNQNRALWPC